MKTHLQPKVLVIFLLFYCFLLPLESQSQFRFQLEKMSPTLYKVCAVSEKEYSPPSSIIVSAQVTLKMSFDSQFNVEKIKSDIFSNGWEIAPEVIDFEKAPNTKYYSINVSNKGESPQKILVDECIELFRISTEKSIGKGVEFTLIEEDDPLVLNKLKTRKNISNQINVIGYKEGNENAYLGNLPIKENQGTPIEISNIYPNPATSTLTMSWSYNLDDLVHESIVIHIVESASGLIKKDVSIDSYLQGRNTIDITLDQLNQGNYLIYLKNSKFQSKAFHFSKIN